MKRAMRWLFFLLLLFFIAGNAYAQELRFFEPGDFRLESSQVIKECKLGYRTFGTLAPDKSNAILFPSWFAGTSKELIDLGIIGPGKIVDTSRFYVIAVDSIGNGVSSSPSNSKVQPGASFPEFTIRDMVAIGHLLLTHELHLERLHAVAGISMGGMQAFEWMVSHPGFFKKAVSIVGSPRPAVSDLLQCRAEVLAIQAGSCGNIVLGMQAVAAMHTTALRTPQYIDSHTAPNEFPQFLEKMEKNFARFDPNDWEWQLKAIMGHNIYRNFDGSPERASAAVKAKTLIVYNRQDRMVNPEPSLHFAGSIGAQTVEIPSDCGHAVFLCEKDKLRDVVEPFLAK